MDSDPFFDQPGDGMPAFLGDDGVLNWEGGNGVGSFGEDGHGPEVVGPGDEAVESAAVAVGAVGAEEVVGAVGVEEAGVGSAEWQRRQALLQEATETMPILTQAKQAVAEKIQAMQEAMRVEVENSRICQEQWAAGSVALETAQKQLVAYLDEADGKLEATRLEKQAMDDTAAYEAFNEKRKAANEQSRKEAEYNQAKRRRLSLGPMGLDGAVAADGEGDGGGVVPAGGRGEGGWAVPAGGQGEGQRGVGLSMAALKKWLPCITNADTRNAIVESSGMFVTNIFCILGPGGSGQAVTYEMEKLTTHLTNIFGAEEMHIPSCDVDLLMNGDW
jgi:hypothetical protein